MFFVKNNIKVSIGSLGLGSANFPPTVISLLSVDVEVRVVQSVKFFLSEEYLYLTVQELSTLWPVETV